MAWTVAGNIRGPQGVKGDKGDQGDPGAAGSGVTIQGTDTWANISAIASPTAGQMWILSADDATAPGTGGGHAGDGLVWSGSAWTNVGPIRGPQGTAATITVGSVSALGPGATPTITNSGSSTNATLDFGIPAGAKGDQGNTGLPGAAATIEVGTVTGLAAGASPTVSNTGTAAAAVFNFGIPAGATGSTGGKGDPGTRGSNWYSGIGAPGTVTGSAAGDYYLDAASGDVYTLS